MNCEYELNLGNFYSLECGSILILCRCVINCKVYGKLVCIIYG